MLERRPAADSDEGFLRRLYVTTRPELAAWDDAARDTFVDIQLRAQTHSWRERFPGSVDELIVVDGRQAGRIWLAWLPDECRVVDIALLPEYRRLRIGSALIGEILGEADRRGVCVRLTAERLNDGARAFWASVGFMPVAEDAVFLELERQPGAPATS